MRKASVCVVGFVASLLTSVVCTVGAAECTVFGDGTLVCLCRGSGLLCDHPGYGTCEECEGGR